jgi:ferredoxin
MGIPNLIFVVVFLAACILFWRNASKISRNIKLGMPLDRSDRKGERWRLMTLVAFGQKKMFSRPWPALLHFFVYAGFVIINIEVAEIVIDGIFGTHRVLSVAGGLYPLMLASFEVLAFLVTAGCVIFLIRRNITKVKRLVMKELDGWPKTDANLILIMEISLMTAFFFMNAADRSLFISGHPHYNVDIGFMPVSGYLAGFFSGWESSQLVFLERFCWWFHIIGILAFLNYLVVSKHLHIILAFPNVFFSRLEPKGKFDNLESVTGEVKLMLDPTLTPPPAPETPLKFGARDATDLSWKQLLDAYTCTECGRCTSECPANITGKKLSPRKIMMDTRDRIDEIGKNLDKGKKPGEDGKALLNDYISPEELWACTSCNACVQACPVNIDPLSIIMDLRRYLVMEQSAAPNEINLMLTNIENNQAPWQFSPADRLNWAQEK